MARIKIDMPAKFLADFTIPVRISDINYGNHVGNDAFVALVHEVRVQWLQSHGYTELAIEGVGLIMSDLAVEFKNESLYGDIIDASIGVGELTRISFELYYQLSVNRPSGKVLLSHAKTGMVCYDYAAKKVAPVPEKLKAILSS